MTVDPKIVPLGIDAVTVGFGNAISETVNRRVLAIARALERRPFPGFAEAVPAFASLTVFFDPLSVRNWARGASVSESVAERVREILRTCSEFSEEQSRLIEIPADFSPIAGPDTSAIAETARIGTERVIDIFTAREYRVHMLGFLPGFAYMAEVDERIASPRKPTPRIRIPAGSIGIAGRQTGIYPLESPGGWQIIGRTDFPLFTPGAPEPTSLSPGDRVRFIRIK